ncbi:hypothetical protein LCGC14_0972440 [marine sediment metagenome]|uniref:DUF7694 domain-containing protein n=1 Tax=marine sediment metagenome TaxID=412755 RepID=A0A0F9NXJ1_9ZZZZ
MKEGTYNLGECRIIVSKDMGFWHLSISHQTRYPTFDEIRDARYKFLPNNITVAMLYPPKEEYINLHNNCFHLWELK